MATKQIHCENSMDIWWKLHKYAMYLQLLSQHIPTIPSHPRSSKTSPNEPWRIPRHHATIHITILSTNTNDKVAYLLYIGVPYIYISRPYIFITHQQSWTRESITYILIYLLFVATIQTHDEITICLVAKLPFDTICAGCFQWPSCCTIMWLGNFW
jgi:hypothetical protein